MHFCQTTRPITKFGTLTIKLVAVILKTFPLLFFIHSAAKIKENIYLLDGKKDVFEMRINAAFGVRISLEEIVKVNSGISSTINWDLGTLQDELNEKIKEAGRYYYKSPKHTKILKQYSKYSFLGNYSEPLYSNNTGYSDEKVKELLRDYEENIKKPIINMLYDYYRVKFNPDLEMEGYLLEQLGFRACSHCF